MANIPVEETPLQEKVYNLYLELLQAEKDKKDAAKMHSENIKRIKEEMQEVIEKATEETQAAQREA